MKQIFSLVVAGMIGGLIALGGARMLQAPPAAPAEAPIQATLASHLNISPRASAVPFDFREAAAAAMPAVVHIAVRSGESQQPGEDPSDPNDFFRFFFDEDFLDNPFGNRPRQGSGSGVIYTADGYIVTNNHVVESADQVEVTLYDNRTFTATVVGTYEKSDLAVLKIEAVDLPYIDLADSDAVEVGEWVLAVGNPFELTSTVTAGIVSAKGRSIRLLGGNDAIEAFIQTDAAVNPGNSGGALVNADGKLIGINTAIATRTGVFQGYSFAIPVNLVTRIVDDIIRTGSFQRAFLGVEISELNGEYADELGVRITQGVVVEKLVDGGSAQYAGLQPKDIIVQVDDRPIKGVPELQEIIGRARVGDVINLRVNRQGRIVEVPVALKAR
jgi:Do/DeqQ family serine protease